MNNQRVMVHQAHIRRYMNIIRSCFFTEGYGLLRRAVALAGIGALFMVLSCASAQENAASYCPSFGNYSGRIDSEATVLSEETGRKLVYVRMRDGSSKPVPIRFISNARELSSKDDYEEFMRLYNVACGGIPPFRDEIEYHRKRGNSHSRVLTLKSELQAIEPDIATKWKAELSLIKRRQRSASYYDDSIASLKSQIEKEDEALNQSGMQTFIVTGETNGRFGDRELLVFGSAVPIGNIMQPGFVSDNWFLIRNYRKEDFPAQVPIRPMPIYSQEYYYVGVVQRGRGRLELFDRNPPAALGRRLKPALARKKKLQQELDNLVRLQKYATTLAELDQLTSDQPSASQE